MCFLDANPSNIIFTVNNTKLNVPIVTLSLRDKQKISELLSKGFGRSMYWNEFKLCTKYWNEFKSNFVGANRLFVLIYSNEVINAKRNKGRKYYLPKGIIKNYKVIIDGKNFYDQPICFDIKRYKEIRKLITGQGEGYTTEYL